MSWDISIDADDCKECGNHLGIEVGNGTYNYSPAYFQAMGFSLGDLNGVLAAVPIAALEAGIKELRERPSIYAPLIRGGGAWGTLDSAISYLHKLLDACKAMPKGKIHVG